jgi:hypothetical protein
VEHFLNDEGRLLFSKWVNEVERRMKASEGFTGIEQLTVNRYPE